MSEKMPILARLNRQLQKHGLTFADALNLALFLLTIASLFLAYQGVRLARVTLNEAREQGKEQTSQFKEQQSQLETSTRSLERAIKDLDDQNQILQDLQVISSKQLGDLDAAENREKRQEKARPMPLISGTCNNFDFLRVSEKDFRYWKRRHLQNAINVTPIEFETSFNCKIYLRNEGDADLKNVSLSADLVCQVGASVGTVVFLYINNNVASGHKAILISQGTVPSRLRLNRGLETSFSIKFNPCRKFAINLWLEADHFDMSETTTEITLQPVPKPPVMQP